MKLQESTYRCECGSTAPVERIAEYEFHAECPACGRITVLSWAHDEPAPAFEAERSPRLPLRTEGQ